MTVEIAIT